MRNPHKSSKMASFSYQDGGVSMVTYYVTVINRNPHKSFKMTSFTCSYILLFSSKFNRKQSNSKAAIWSSDISLMNINIQNMYHYKALRAPYSVDMSSNGTAHSEGASSSVVSDRRMSPASADDDERRAARRVMTFDWTCLPDNRLVLWPFPGPDLPAHS